MAVAATKTVPKKAPARKAPLKAVPAKTAGKKKAPVDANAPKHRREWTQVTPAFANQLLGSLHENQRSARDSRVEQYAQDMRAGDWREDSEDSIMIDWDGHLIDGQNRLMAVVESGRSIWFWVVYDCDPEIMSVKDTGAARTISDALRIKGLGADMSAAQLKVVAGIARRELYWSSGRYMKSASKGLAAATHSEIAKLILNQKDILFAAKLGMDQGRLQKGLAQANLYGFFWLKVNRIAGEDATRFHSYWMSPEDLPGNSPIAALRDRLYRSALVKKTPTGTHRGNVLNEDEKLALFFRAWNMFVSDRLALRGTLQVSRGPLKNDNFPQPLTPKAARAMPEDDLAASPKR